MAVAIDARTFLDWPGGLELCPITPAAASGPQAKGKAESTVDGNVPQRLPSVDDLPDADVVIYDGQCRFCRAQVERLARWDGAGRLAFISLHDPRVAERYPDLSHDQLMEQMYVVDRRGRRHGGAAALKYLSRRLPRLWWCAPLLHLPGTLPLWQTVYRYIARRRYWLWRRHAQCDDDRCSIHFAPPKNDPDHP